MRLTDEIVYDRYPKLTHIYDKLWLSKMLGYECGTIDDPIPRAGRYIVRPIINLSGLAEGAKDENHFKGDHITDPNDFWCEYFYGEHVSVDFTYQNGKWVQGLTVKGHPARDFRFFSAWEKYDGRFEMPQFLIYELYGSGVVEINIEYIGKNVIEVHLRRNPDFSDRDFDMLYVVDNLTTLSMIQYFKDSGYTWIPDVETPPGYTRLGFYGRKFGNDALKVF